METIDFSTQYPWSFGALSVVMATGNHGHIKALCETPPYGAAKVLDFFKNSSDFKVKHFVSRWINPLY